VAGTGVCHEYERHRRHVHRQTTPSPASFAGTISGKTSPLTKTRRRASLTFSARPTPGQARPPSAPVTLQARKSPGAVPDSTNLVVNGILDLAAFRSPGRQTSRASVRSPTPARRAGDLHDRQCRRQCPSRDLFAGKLALTKDGVGKLTLVEGEHLHPGDRHRRRHHRRGGRQRAARGDHAVRDGKHSISPASRNRSLASPAWVRSPTAPASPTSPSTTPATVTFGGTLTGALNLVKTASGILLLTNANTYSGFDWHQRRHPATGRTLPRFPTTSDVLVAGTLDLHGFAAAIGALTGKWYGPQQMSPARRHVHHRQHQPQCPRMAAKS